MENTVLIPDKVKIELSGMKVIVKGPKHELSMNFDNPMFKGEVEMSVDNNQFKVKTNSEKRKTKALVGAISAHVKNMSLGVTEGFKYKMKILFTHFPMNVTVKDKEVSVKNFLGEKGARISKIVGDTQVKIDKEDIEVTGHNKEDVGQTMANLERACKLKRKDRRVFTDGIFLASKNLQSGEEIR